MQPARFGILALLLAGLVLGGCVRDYGPTQTRARAAAPAIVHIVQEGDTISGVAARYGVGIRTVCDANDLRSTKLVPGTRLVIPGGRMPEPERPPETAQPTGADRTPAAPTNDWFTPRAAWAVEPIVMDRINPMGGRPNRITIHHTAMAGIDDGPDTVAILRLIDKRHHGRIGRNGENGACIGYHFLVARNGTVYEGRPLQYQGAHSGGDNNRLNIGVCLLGDFNHVQMPTAQKAAAVAVVDRLRAAYGIPRSQVFGHRDFNPPGSLHTECPGRYLYPLVIGYRRGQIGKDVPTETGTAQP